jgi:broad specificity phosphatase PhoE
MSDKEIAHVFSTNTLRTKATVQPLVDQNGLEIEIYDAKKHDDLVKELRNRKGNVLVVGHSNTVHHLANYFVGKSEPYPELTDIEYNFIFVVSLNPDGTSLVGRKIYKDF